MKEKLNCSTSGSLAHTVCESKKIRMIEIKTISRYLANVDSFTHANFSAQDPNVANISGTAPVKSAGPPRTRCFLHNFSQPFLGHLK